MENSKIAWTHHTMNFWWGCNRVSEECRFCYIGPFMRWTGNEPFRGPRITGTISWKKPASWQRKAEKLNTRYRVFTCSMSDFFHEGADEWRPEAWDIIRDCNRLDWLILTKRPELIRDRLPADWGKDGYPNVWLGVSCGIESSLERIDLLKQIPARSRFISAEPLLGPLDFSSYLDGSIDWIITGCENAGKDNRRPMNLDWVRDIDQQCRDAGVAHFYKQYYVGNQLQYDGVIDGEVRQEFPSLN